MKDNQAIEMLNKLRDYFAEKYPTDVKIRFDIYLSLQELHKLIEPIVD